jgi:hypothetical protein
MKYATPRAGDWRAQTRERQRRGRLSAAPLRERYPDVASVRLEFEFRDRGAFPPASQVTVLHPPASAYFSFPCPCNECDGEFDLAAAVESSINGKSARDKGEQPCGGQRTREKVRSACSVVLEYQVTVQRD